jgi:hypothetical protein
VSKVVHFPDVDRRSRHPDAVHRDLSESAVVIILPIVRVERYEEEKRPRRRRSRVRPGDYETPF